MNRRRIKWLLLVLVCGFIFYFSSQDGIESTELSNTFVNFLEEYVSFFNFLPVLVRKMAHFSIYFLLGMISVSLLKEYFVSWGKIVIYALIFCFVYAVSDEIHQLFVLGRSSRIFDVFIDFCGSFCATFCLSLWKYFHKKKVV